MNTTFSHSDLAPVWSSTRRIPALALAALAALPANAFQHTLFVEGGGSGQPATILRIDACGRSVVYTAPANNKIKGIATDAGGNLYAGLFCDSGSPTCGYGGALTKNGAVMYTTQDYVLDVSVDSVGDVFFVAQNPTTLDTVVKKFRAGGATTVASALPTYHIDTVAVDDSGNVYTLQDGSNSLLVKNHSVLARSQQSMSALAVDACGNVLYSDGQDIRRRVGSSDNAIYAVSSAFKVKAVAGDCFGNFYVGVQCAMDPCPGSRVIENGTIQYPIGFAVSDVEISRCVGLAIRSAGGDGVLEEFAAPTCGGVPLPATAMGGFLRTGQEANQDVGVLQQSSQCRVEIVGSTPANCQALRVGFIQNLVSSVVVGFYENGATRTKIINPACSPPLLDAEPSPSVPFYNHPPATTLHNCNQPFDVWMQDRPGVAFELEWLGRKLESLADNRTYVTWLAIENQGQYCFAYHWEWRTAHSYTLQNNNGQSATVLSNTTCAATISSGTGCGQGPRNPKLVGPTYGQGCERVIDVGF